MKTSHNVFFQSAERMDELPNDSIDLVVTSPPYPMIKMWDEVLARQDTQIATALKQPNGMRAFELMHQVLDGVWQEVWRVLKPGGIACINIGDATRTLDGHFALYTNHARILTTLQQLGFSSLPAILWRKQTNAPNKFMGSGMMPPGAYVTLEHEYILVVRKGGKREFLKSAAKRLRRESAYFWEERNRWFSDVWMDLKGTTQGLGVASQRVDPKTRKRSGAFPFELPYRLISMFSVKGDTVLDPFLGLGTTMAGAMAAGRHSIGYEIDRALGESIDALQANIVSYANQRISQRLDDHVAFVGEREAKSGALKHTNNAYGFPVVTSQEIDLLLNVLISVDQKADGGFEVSYSEDPQYDMQSIGARAATFAPTDGKNLKIGGFSRQRSLFE